MRHLISILLQNEAGALARVAGLFASRGYNIESLTVAATPDVEASRLTLVIFGDDGLVDQIIKQSRKLVDVIEIAELTRRDHLERELLVVRTDGAPERVDACVQQFGARVLERHGTSVLVEFTGQPDEVDRCLDALMRAAELCEHARSGIAAIERAVLTMA
ncbi:acetolactate synthase-1/3 small subunit [Luteibacter sp. Sphag1AF]|uniref:acetolactate synthase small subunit n=1 Tax=Luteibacter sp. Sphag1AF TaxID=2587031 RepID=UPI001621A752|nr:acetolactate synthase small subunit [Luteibacter sp. Sphag1AF]MBB3227998.1 acetolactate synthase-1/3 small subunit [Luteibacter sp. Sphag1AF]